MTALANTINVILTQVFDVLCWPVHAASAVWALLFLSLVTSVFFLLIYGRVSNQAALKRVKDRLRGSLLGIRIFRDQVGTVFRLQAGLLGTTCVYLVHSLLPVAILIIPMVLILAQLNLRFSVRPLAVGESTILQVRVADSALLKGEVRLDVPEGLSVETSAVRIASQGEAAWRIRAEAPGTHVVNFTFSSSGVQKTGSKSVVVGERWGRVPAKRMGAGFFSVILWPGESLMPDRPSLLSASLRYSPLPLTIFGMSVHWLLLFFVATFALSLLMKRWFSVEF